MDSPDEAKEIAEIITRLEKQFPAAPPGEVAAITHEVHGSMAGRPVRNYVPVLVERAVRDRLRGRPAS